MVSPDTPGGQALKPSANLPMTVNTKNDGALASIHLLSTKAAAREFGISHRTLEDWRLTGNGPLFVKLGRRVFYRLTDLTQFLEGQLRSNTAQQAA
jgi:hypothetical protein